MKTILALVIALAMPVSAQAATLAVPEYHTFTQQVNFPSGPTSFCCNAGGVSTTIYQIHLGQVLTFKELTGGYSTVLDPSWNDPNTPPRYFVRTFGDGASVTFLMLDDADSFSFLRNGTCCVGVTETISTPLPAALPLFAAGLGIVVFLARRRKYILLR